MAHYPQRFPGLLGDAPSGPLIYTGGLENYPRVVSRLASEKTLWGTTADALRLARDPFHVARLLRENNLPVLDVSRVAKRSIGKMLRKPRRSAGGAHIAFAENDEPASRTFYYQQFMPGPSLAAAFCASADRVELLGVTEQLVGEPWLNAKPFHYCGSTGPIEISSTQTDALRQLGEVLRTGCSLRGLFGVDFILNDDRPWLIEVNPRYTASIEVLEYATGMAALAHHRAAFDREYVAPAAPEQRSTLVGKAILFAPRRFAFPADGPWIGHPNYFMRPDFADIPAAGTIIEEGWPIMTIFAHGSSNQECLNHLREIAQLAFAACGVAAIHPKSS